jgi:hypothetical protein
MALAAEPVMATPVAVVKVLKGDVRVLRQEQQTPLAVGMELTTNDRVLTGSDGSVGLAFRDGSLLSVGANGDLAVNRFEFDSTTYEGRFETTLNKGRMSVVSGKIAKSKHDAMKVRTPSSTLGIRGTEFLVEATP